MNLYVRLFIVVMLSILFIACYESWDEFRSGCNETSEENTAVENDENSSQPPEPSEADEAPVHSNSQFSLPPANAPFDYQLGGAYSPASGVKVVSRDRNDPPAASLYNICYINGFQVQPGEERLWPDDLILRDNSGNPVVDSGWDEMLLDISTDAKRRRIAEVLGEWIEECAADGYDAIEIDNLDSYSRSGNRLKQNHAVSMMALISPIAHENQMAIAQKNSTELLEYKNQMGTDFAMAEECSRYNECGDYIDYYGENVLMIEYRVSDFNKGCNSYGATHSIVLRDLMLRKPGSGSYIFDGC